MRNWFLKYKTKDYTEILKKAFPKNLEKDLNVVLDIIPLNVNYIKSHDGNTYQVEDLIYDYFINVQIENEELSIPYRIYFNEPGPKQEEDLTTEQKVLLNCIYLNHHNGFVRQKRLQQLEQCNKYWTTPFRVRLLGEYVLEILEVLHNEYNDDLLENYKKFALENPNYWLQTESRMISYWDKYYRQKFPKRKLYVGGIIFDTINSAVLGKRKH